MRPFSRGGGSEASTSRGAPLTRFGPGAKLGTGTRVGSCTPAEKAETDVHERCALALARIPLERLAEREREEARSLQQAIIQVEPLCGASIEFASRFRPFVDVGGDFLDYFRLSDTEGSLEAEKLGVLVALGEQAAQIGASGLLRRRSGHGLC